MNSTCGACPLVDALRRIREDMDRASLSGDEWAMEWMSDVWSDLPLAVRAAGGDQDAAHELAAQKLAAGLAAPTNHDTDETVLLPPTTRLSYRLEHRYDGETTWRQGVPGLGLRWTYAERAKADQRLAEARERWPQYEHRMVVITTTVSEAVAAGAES